MHFFKKHPNFLKYTCLATITCSAGWLYYQVKKTQDILSNALDTSILSIAEPPVTGNHEDDDFFIINWDKIHNQDFTFVNAWSTLKFEFAKRLLILANNENRFIRKKAVRQLAKLKNLEHWHFSQLSNMIDARTAVGLARTASVDPRLFIEPPLRYVNHSHDMILDVMRELLISLHAKSQHPCMGYFISKVFVDMHENYDRFADHEGAPIELKKFIQSSHEVLPMCLETLVHHASVKDYAKDIAELNGLPLLMEIHNRFKENINISATICRIISYLSMHNDLLDDLFKTGWISVLSQWVKHDDVRISIPAAKALANLDLDEDAIYLQRLYPLHPDTRLIRKPAADVVFIHGLLGGVFFTWRQRKRHQDPLGFLGKKGAPESITQDNSCSKTYFKSRKKISDSSDPDVKEFIEDLEEHLSYDCPCKDYEIVWEDIPINTNLNVEDPYCCSTSKFIKINREEDCFTNCWPKDWLAEDYDDLRIIGVNYETNLSLWTPICPVEKVRSLEERSNELMFQLTKIGLGKRPIIWVTHSMGGLIVKDLLCKAFESNNKEIKDMCLNTKAIVFYSTPHVGSNVASFSQATALVIWPTTEVQELQENSPKLVEIHDKFLEVTREVPMKIVSFIETKPTLVSAMRWKFLIVQPHSGNPGIGEYYEIPLDHLGICKPASRHSFLYQKVLDLIQEVLNDDCKSKMR